MAWPRKVVRRRTRKVVPTLLVGKSWELESTVFGAAATSVRTNMLRGESTSGNHQGLKWRTNSILETEAHVGNEGETPCAEQPNKKVKLSGRTHIRRAKREPPRNRSAGRGRGRMSRNHY